MIAAATAMALGLGGQQAQATSMTYSGYSVLNNQNVTLSGSAMGGRTETGGSGQVTMTNTNTPGGSIATWCIDVMHDLLQSGSFSTGSTLFGSLGDRINALLTHVLPNLASNVNASSALQVAIWETEYGASLTISADQAVLDLATSYLNHLNGVGGLWSADATKSVAILDGNGINQSQVFLAASVPEPATFAVLGSGLAALGFLRRRQAAPAT